MIRKRMAMENNATGKIAAVAVDEEKAEDLQREISNEGTRNGNWEQAAGEYD